MLLDTSKHSSREKGKKVTDINPACGNLQEMIMGKITGNMY